MNTELKSKVDLMADNFHELKNAFKWESHLIQHFGAMICATREAKVNIEHIREVKAYIKAQTSWVSYFRGHNEMIVSMLLANEAGYEQIFERANKVYEDLKATGFSRGSYLPLAAITIAISAEPANYPVVYQRMDQIYQNMKKNHFWLTSQDDYVLASVLAASDLDVDKTSAEMERCYEILNRGGIYKSNELQSLSHVLSMGEESAEAKCQKAMAIQMRLKSSPCKLKYQGLVSLGVLALVSDQPEEIADEVLEVYEYLYQTDGYGFWGIDSNLRGILAASIVSDFYADHLNNNLIGATVANSITSIIIAQQTAMMAAVAASSAAASSAASS